jgi:predicted phosphoribosyltransferase
MYLDRIEAGSILAKALAKYQGQPGVILAVPRGGVPIACVVARELHLPVELLLTKKIGHPRNSEYAIGAVSLTDRYLVQHEGIPEAYIEKETQRIRRRLNQMYHKFMGEDHRPEAMKGKTVIVIDDGIATGNTLMSAIALLRQEEPAHIIIAVPVASHKAIEKLSDLVDEIVCPLVPKTFLGVGAFYEHFDQVSDEEVIYHLNKLKTSNPTG